MSAAGQQTTTRHGWYAVTAWAALPVLLGGYLFLDFWIATPTTVALAQVVYLIPPMLAAAFAASAAWVAPRRVRAKYVWGLLAAVTAFMFLSEAYSSWSRLATGGGFAVVPLFDALNVLAFTSLVIMMSIAASLERFGVKRSLRLFLDTGALLTLGFVVMFRFLLDTMASSVQIFDAARMTVYTLAGVLVLTMTIYVHVTTPVARRKIWATILTLGIGVYSTAMLLWPFWSLSATRRQPAAATEAAISALFLVGYYLIFMAGLYRVAAAEEPWEDQYSEPSLRPAAWQGITVSVLVLLTVVYLGFATYSVPSGSRAQLVHWACLLFATACLVGRTALATLEADDLRSRSLTDPLTGAPNPRSFDEQITGLFAANRRFGAPFALILLDLDDFGRVNESMSLSAGDRVLADVVVALSQVIGSVDNVFRMSSDEFAILIPIESRRDTEIVARVVRKAIRTVPVPGRPLTASIGYALCPDDALQRDALVARADGALAWAKRHGKDRVIGYDERVERALGAAGQLQTLEQDTRLDMVRALSAAADARDLSSHFHSRSVAALSCLLAGDLDFEPDHIERVRIAALLHDVGKIAASTTVYGRTTPERLKRAVGEHCELGERMLHSLAVPGVASWVRSHHEHWDGTGFPDGLKGHSIPIEARIIALADAYDNMTSAQRPGGALSKAAALQDIDQSIGTRFDPTLADKFIRVVASTEAFGWTDEWPAA